MWAWKVSGCLREWTADEVLSWMNVTECLCVYETSAVRVVCAYSCFCVSAGFGNELLVLVCDGRRGQGVGCCVLLVVLCVVCYCVRERWVEGWWMLVARAWNW